MPFQAKPHMPTLSSAPSGDKPELRWPEAKAELVSMGFESTLDYVHHVAKEVLLRTGLLPHINAGVMSQGDLERCGRLWPSAVPSVSGGSPSGMKQCWP